VVVTLFNVLIVVLGVSAVACIAIAAWLGGGRSGQGGPAAGSLDRDDDDQTDKPR
jgi:hypothetical protein